MTKPGNRILKAVRKNGFTLVEILAVAAIIALLFSASIASYAGTFKRWSVEQNARQLYMAAKSARQYAIEHQQSCTLVLDRENGQFFLMTERNTGQGDMALVSTPWSRKVRLQRNVTFETIKIAGRYEDIEGGVVFRPDGTANTAAIQLGNGTVHYTVVINGGTSRPRLSEGQAQELQSDQIDLDLMEEV